MSKNLTETRSEVERGFQFLVTLQKNGHLYKKLQPILQELESFIEKEEKNESSANTTDTVMTDNQSVQNTHESIVKATHKAMYEEGFICIVEKPSTVPGFAASLRELPQHQLPDGWNSNSTNYSLMYKHKLKQGKQFLLMCSILMDDSILGVTITEKGGQSYGTEIDLEDFIQVVDEDKYTTLKSYIQSLAWQIIPQLEINSKANTPTTANTTNQPTPLPLPQIPTLNNPYGDGSGGFRPTPIVPYPSGGIPVGGPGGGYDPRGVGRGDFQPAHPGIPSPYSPIDPGSGSQVGPDHPLFNPQGRGQGNGYPDNNPNNPNNPYINEDPQYFDPLRGPSVPGWAPGLPRPRFDPFGPIPGSNPLANFGPNGGGRGGMGGRGGRGDGLGGRGGQRLFPGEPNPDHLRPPRDNNDFI